MPHSFVSTVDEHGRKVCPYCGIPIRLHQVTCAYHRDLPALEELDDRYTISEDGKQ